MQRERRVKVQVGKLYRFGDEQFVVDIDYQVLGEASPRFWGELIPMDYVRIADGGDYRLELDDSRKVRCNLKQRVNRAAIGIPARYVYQFVATALSE